MAKHQRLNVIGDDTNSHKSYASKQFSQHDLVSFKPKTNPQRQFFSSYADQVPVIMQLGSAGTGKTACALYAALSDVFDKSNPREKIIIIRSAAQTREIGFLPGEQGDKDKPYESAYEGLCDQLLQFKTNNYENLKAKGIIEFKNTSFLRGETFDNTIILVDECQSMTYHELCTCITRVGVNSKIVFMGDTKQNDLHKRNDVSGLPQFLRVLEKMRSSTTDLVIYRPEDIVRSGIVREFLLAEEQAS